MRTRTGCRWGEEGEAVGVLVELLRMYTIGELTEEALLMSYRGREWLGGLVYGTGNPVFEGEYRKRKGEV